MATKVAANGKGFQPVSIMCFNRTFMWVYRINLEIHIADLSSMILNFNLGTIKYRFDNLCIDFIGYRCSCNERWSIENQQIRKIQCKFGRFKGWASN